MNESDAADERKIEPSSLSTGISCGMYVKKGLEACACKKNNNRANKKVKKEYLPVRLETLSRCHCCSRKNYEREDGS